MKANNLLTAAIVSGSLGMAPVFVQAGGDDWRGKPERFGYEERGYDREAETPVLLCRILVTRR